MLETTGGLLPLLISQVQPGESTEAALDRAIKSGEYLCLRDRRAAPHAIGHPAKAYTVPQQAQSYLRIIQGTSGVK